jgi:hypothetical protein
MLGRVTAAVRTIFGSATPAGSLIAAAGTRAPGHPGGDPRPVFAAAGPATRTVAHGNHTARRICAAIPPSHDEHPRRRQRRRNKAQSLAGRRAPNYFGWLRDLIDGA